MTAPDNGSGKKSAHSSHSDLSDDGQSDDSMELQRFDTEVTLPKGKPALTDRHSDHQPNHLREAAGECEDEQRVQGTRDPAGDGVPEPNRQLEQHRVLAAQ